MIATNTFFNINLNFAITKLAHGAFPNSVPTDAAIFQQVVDLHLN